MVNYNKKNFSANGTDIYIIYSAGSLAQPLIDSHAIPNNSFKIIKTKKIGGFIINRKLFLIKKK